MWIGISNFSGYFCPSHRRERNFGVSAHLCDNNLELKTFPKATAHCCAKTPMIPVCEKLKFNNPSRLFFLFFSSSCARKHAQDGAGGRRRRQRRGGGGKAGPRHRSKSQTRGGRGARAPGGARSRSNSRTRGAAGRGPHAGGGGGGGGGGKHGGHKGGKKKKKHGSGSDSGSDSDAVSLKSLETFWALLVAFQAIPSRFEEDGPVKPVNPSPGPLQRAIAAANTCGQAWSIRGNSRRPPGLVPCNLIFILFSVVIVVLVIFFGWKPVCGGEGREGLEAQEEHQGGDSQGGQAAEGATDRFTDRPICLFRRCLCGRLGVRLLVAFVETAACFAMCVSRSLLFSDVLGAVPISPAYLRVMSVIVFYRFCRRPKNKNHLHDARILPDPPWLFPNFRPHRES